MSRANWLFAGPGYYTHNAKYNTACHDQIGFAEALVITFTRLGITPRVMIKLALYQYGVLHLGRPVLDATRDYQG